MRHYSTPLWAPPVALLLAAAITENALAGTFEGAPGPIQRPPTGKDSTFLGNQTNRQNQLLKRQSKQFSRWNREARQTVWLSDGPSPTMAFPPAGKRDGDMGGLPSGVATGAGGANASVAQATTPAP